MKCIDHASGHVVLTELFSLCVEELVQLMELVQLLEEARENVGSWNIYRDRVFNVCWLPPACRGH